MRAAIAALVLLFVLVAASPSSSIGQPLVCNEPVPCTDTVALQLSQPGADLALLVILTVALVSFTFTFIYPRHRRKR